MPRCSATRSKAAQGFLDLGVKPGTRVGLFLPNTPHYPIAYYGALLAGATVVNFSPLYSPEEVAFQARDSGTEIMVCLDLAKLWAPMQRLLDDGLLKHLDRRQSPRGTCRAAKALGFPPAEAQGAASVSPTIRASRLGVTCSWPGEQHHYPRSTPRPSPSSNIPAAPPACPRARR